MDLRQLGYVVAVADHGSFTKAAASQRVSQPSLSNGVRKLESELGIELFARLGRNARPTSAGEQVVEAARRVLQESADLVAVSRAASELRVGRLDLVALPTLAVDPLAELIGAFRTRYPELVVRVGEPEDAASLEQQIKSGRAELGFTDLTTGGAGLARIDLFRQDVFAVCPPSTDVADGPIPAADFVSMPLIVTPPGTSTRRLVDRIAAHADLAPRIVVEIHHREAILPLVLAGAGVALLPSPLAREAALRGAVVRRLRPDLRRRIGMLHRRGTLSPAALAMIRLAKTHRPTGLWERSAVSAPS